MPIWTEEMTQRAVGMRRAGISMRDVAARLGITERSLSNKMHRVGAKAKLTRPKGRKAAGTVYGRLVPVGFERLEDMGAV